MTTLTQPPQPVLGTYNFHRFTGWIFELWS